MTDLTKVSTIELYKELHKRENTTVEIILNKCYGGFKLSKFALKELGHKVTPLCDTWELICKYNTDRCNTKLIELIKLHGSEKISGRSSKLEIEHIDLIDGDGICETDGFEYIEWGVGGIGDYILGE